MRILRIQDGLFDADKIAFIGTVGSKTRIQIQFVGGSGVLVYNYDTEELATEALKRIQADWIATQFDVQIA